MIEEYLRHSNVQSSIAVSRKAQVPSNCLQVATVELELAKHFCLDHLPRDIIEGTVSLAVLLSGVDLIHCADPARFGFNNGVGEHHLKLLLLEYCVLLAFHIILGAFLLHAIGAY
jgi:hypothetical protein